MVYDEKYIVVEYRKGRTTKDIAMELGTYNTTIRRILKRNNVKLRGVQKVNSSVKHNPFKRNDELSDYFLGLIATDGSISNDVFTLSLKESDKYIVEELNDFLKKTTPVSRTYHSTHKYVAYECRFRDKRGLVLDWLRRKCNFINKSYEAKLYVPINYNILRGIIDGNGSIMLKEPDSPLKYTVISICGRSRAFMEQIKFFLNKEGYKVTERTREDGLITISVCRRLDVLRLGYNLYNNANIFLMRKYLNWSHYYENSRTNNRLNSVKEWHLTLSQIHPPYLDKVVIKEDGEVQRL